MKLKSIPKAIRNHDSFGHTIEVVFKGRETYNSILGGLLTLVVQAITIYMVVDSAIEIALMNEPLIQSYQKPLSLEEK